MKLNIIQYWLLIFSMSTISCSDVQKSCSYISALDIATINNNFEFIESLTANLKEYFTQNITSTYEQRTDYWSLQPFRMFWQGIFISNETRKIDWELAFQDNGALSNKAIEQFINAQVDKYNQGSSQNDKLNYVRLQPYNTAEILSEQVFDLIKDKELDIWMSSIWFVPLLSAILCCFILFIEPMTYITVIVGGILEAICALIFNFFSGDTASLIIDNITLCYLDYIGSQNIMAQIFM